MKQFNQVITIEVSVDAIAQQLLDTIAPDFKHRELLAEAIIGSSLNKGNLSYVYNALNGYDGKINFAVGDEIKCDAKHWNYEWQQSDDNDGGKWTQKNMPIGIATVKEINEYADEKLLITYNEVDHKGHVRIAKRWVKHTDCSRIIPTDDGFVATGASGYHSH